LANEEFPLPFQPAPVYAAYREGRHEAVSEAFLRVLRHFRTVSYRLLNDEMQRLLDDFTKHFLHLFTQEDYVLSDAHIEEFIALNPVIANLVAISSFRTTDAFVRILKGQKHNFAKLLALYSVRNSDPIDRRALLDAQPALATQWYYRFWSLYRSACAGRETLRRLGEHLRFRDERLGAVSGSVAHAFLGCTYVDCEDDRELKRHINSAIRRWDLAQAPIANCPDWRRVAVITGMWFPRHAVYRCTRSFVEALASEFDLTLVHLGPERSDLDTAHFREVRRFQLGDPRGLAALTPNDWGIAYYPDVGLSVESILLANMRLAPIQVSCYGHPVSTHGSLIDYWLGGRDVESPADCERNYSERLVLVPGTGLAPERPQYTPSRSRKPGDVLLVDCPWSGQKINFPMLELLRSVLCRSRRPVRFRFFTGSLDPNGFIPLKRDVKDVLGREYAEVLDALPHEAYMKALEQGDFTLDSYPYGGYATAVDALWLGKPLLAWEGTRFYNRSAASLLRRVGLEELVARDAEAYSALALRLIHDDAYREELSRRLAAADLERTIFSRGDAKYVVEAFRHLVRNYDRLRLDERREPIVIGAGEVAGR
jgi:hypothetical protein